MKKQMKWLLAALALAALATPAFAVTADMTGSLSVRALATNNFDLTDSKGGLNQDHAQFADQRLRLFTSVAANENVKAVLGLEVDNTLGRTDGGTKGKKAYINPALPPGTGVGELDEPGNFVTLPDTAAGKDLGALGTDKTAALEIKHLYLDFKIPALGANVKAGSQPFNFGRGLVINDDAAGLLVNIPCKIMPDNKLELTWIRTSEGATANNDDEGDFYGAKYTAKIGDLAIAPYAGFYTAKLGALTGADTDAGFFGIDADGKAGAFGYALTVLYNNWNKGAVDGNSVALYGKGTFATGNTTLSLEAARYGDSDNGGELMSLAQNAATGPINNFSEILTGGMYTSNSAGFANIGGAANLYSVNYLYGKLGVVQKLSDSMKVSGYVMHIEQAEDTGPAATDEAVTIGQEVDAYFDYTIVPGLGLNLMGAYLFADSDVGEDNAYKLATSLNYKF